MWLCKWTSVAYNPLMQNSASIKDTIAAIATPLGQGGVGIVRVSGPRSKDVGRTLFRSSREDFADFKPYRMHHGWALDERGEALDECLAVFMPGPGSYTGEDVVEFQCHGGPMVVRAILEAVLAQGIRAASAGEFTYRAFVSGRMDLTQAEAVAEMIAAPTRAGMTLAQAKLSGALGQKVAALRAQLEELRAQLCVAVDFPDEDIECLSPEEFLTGVNAVSEAVRDMLENFERDRCWREGAFTVLAGQVNAGKSSLMNALLGRERAIVTDIPGTTRDYLEEAVNLDGLPVRLVDTAGIRETEDAVERAGLERSRDLAAQADLVLLVVDQTRDVAAEDVDLAQRIGIDRVLVVLNKVDIDTAAQDDGLQATWFADAGFEVVPISAKTGKGLNRLCDRVRERIVGRSGEPDAGEIVPNLRQSQALEQAEAELTALAADISAGIPYDLLGVRLEAACTILGEITGEIAPADVLNSIFSSFCIGK